MECLRSFVTAVKLRKCQFKLHRRTTCGNQEYGVTDIEPAERPYTEPAEETYIGPVVQ